MASTNRPKAAAKFDSTEMRFIDLSHPLLDGQPSFPGDPILRVAPHCTTADAARCNLSQIGMGSHQGTHLDAMFHFIDAGKTLDQMPLDWFCGPARVLRIPKNKARASFTRPAGAANIESRTISKIFRR